MSSLFKFLDVINPYEPTDNPNSIIYLVIALVVVLAVACVVIKKLKTNNSKEVKTSKKK